MHAIGRAANKRGIYEGPGVSIKLSALHPRYQRIQRARVMGELLPRIQHLAVLARSYDIGLNIDAEEADRLDLSLDILEALSLDPNLAGWNGLGFVIQAYGKRCVVVVDWLVDLARRARRRLMIRLVKGAYWDSEIKRAQIEGQDEFPVFTRKVHTDVSFLACARKLLAAPDAIYPQFATHNAQTLASVLTMAGPNFYRGQYEFQCLHGMGEPLYEEVVGRDKLDRPCRVYAPVGSHETLLAYLVRRLARKRRQHVVRQPDRRCERVDRRARRRSGRRRRPHSADRRAARQNPFAPQPLRRGAAELARPRPDQRTPPRGAGRWARSERTRSAPRVPARRAGGRDGRCGAESGRSVGCRGIDARRAPRRGRRRNRCGR